MLCRLNIEEFELNIQHIYGGENIVADTLSRFPYISVDKYEPSTKKAQFCVNKSFKNSRAEKNEDFLPLNIFNIRKEQLKYLRIFNSKLSTYISGRRYGYYKQALDDIEIIFYDRKIYVPQALRIRVLD